MATATSKQIAYIEALNTQLPEDQRIKEIRILCDCNDKHRGLQAASRMIDELKAKVAALPKPEPTTSTEAVTCYTQVEDAPHARKPRPTSVDSYMRRRNGPGADELDNQW
jgi:hypothetical protein